MVRESSLLIEVKYQQHLLLWMLGCALVLQVVLGTAAGWVFSQTGTAQHLAVTVLFGIGVVTQSLVLATRRNATGFLVAIGIQQLVVTGLAPLLANYWTVALIATIATTLEAIIVVKTDRIPIVVIIGLLSAAATLAIDLINVTPQLSLLTVSPAIYWTVVATLLGLIGLLGVLLWQVRLRSHMVHRAPMQLATQQSLVLGLTSAISIISVTSVLIWQIRSSQIQQVGQNFQTLATINAERIGNLLEEPVQALQNVGRSQSILIDGLTDANAAYPDGASAVPLLQEREQQWQTSPENSSFVLGLRRNPQTDVLIDFRGRNLLHGDLLLVDREGGLIAAQGSRPPNYAYYETNWWQTAWDNGLTDVYIGDLQLDTDINQATIRIAVGVVDPQTNAAMGVLSSRYRIEAIQEAVTRGNEQSSAELLLVNNQGMIISGPAENGSNIRDWGGLSSILQADTGWQLSTNFAGQPAVVAFARPSTTSGINMAPINSLGWHIIVSDTQVNALVGVNQSVQIAILVALVVLAGVIIVASRLSRVTTRPIEQLTDVATTLSRGDLEQRAEPTGPVELVLLAESFNTLAAQLSSLINNLQQKVEERTAQLEERVRQLAALNRITQTVASVRDLQQELQIVAEELTVLFDARDSGIALFNENQTHLRVVAAYSIREGATIQVGTLLQVQGAISEPVVIQCTDEPGDSNTLQSLMQQVGLERTLIIPLLARGEIIGTIGIGTGKKDRLFTQVEIELAETVAGQVAGALENMRLFGEMEQAKETAEKANRAKSDFLSSVSHELRTPLTSVLGFAKIIRKRLDERILPHVVSDDRKVKRAVNQVTENLDIIVLEGERLTTLINNVLDLAKIEAGRVEWNMEQINMTDVVEHALLATQALFEGSDDISLVTNLEMNTPDVIGDQNRLIQVVINLISNSVKFTEKGTITCQVTSHENDIEVRVADTGVGIAPENLQKIFEPFAQVGDTLTGKPAGTGLGLPICKEIIEYHGGEIRVESAPGEGSRFMFTIPTALAYHAKTGIRVVNQRVMLLQLENLLRNQDRQQRAAKPTALIIDQDKKILTELNSLLTRYGVDSTMLEPSVNDTTLEKLIVLTRPDLLIVNIGVIDAYEKLRHLWEEMRSNQMMLFAYRGKVHDEAQP